MASHSLNSFPTRRFKGTRGNDKNNVIKSAAHPWNSLKDKKRCIEEGGLRGRDRNSVPAMRKSTEGGSTM